MFQKSYFITCVLIIAVLLSSCSTRAVPAWFDETKAHHTRLSDGRIQFKNLYIQDKDKNFFDFMRMRFFGDEIWANHAALSQTVKSQQVKAEDLLSVSNQPKITWLGHSTFLIQFNGLTLLTDPIFGDFASPVSFAGPKRYTPHVVNYDQLPAVDIVVISHNHYDHLDEVAVAALGDSTKFFVPLGLKPWFIEQGVETSNVFEMDWWEQHQIDQTQITALPSQHWSARGLGDRFETLWASWAIRIDEFTLWFAGDTGYQQKIFQSIGDALHGVDLALIPIGAYAPRWFMKDYHVNPEEAARIHLDVKSNYSLGMHWGTFPLTAEPPAEPPQKLKEALTKLGIPKRSFETIALGETIRLPIAAN